MHFGVIKGESLTPLSSSSTVMSMESNISPQLHIHGSKIALLSDRNAP